MFWILVTFGDDDSLYEGKDENGEVGKDTSEEEEGDPLQNHSTLVSVH